jgi:ribosomal protein L11 methyltransferase
VRAADGAGAERAAAEAFEAGAAGLEEREERGVAILLLYVPAARAGAVRQVLATAPGQAWVIGEPEAVPETDWGEAWKRGLRPVEISPRLRVRPSFVEAAPLPGAAELVIDPGQAFGTGGHVSTRLALEWIDALAAQLTGRTRVLDVGSGTGVLALAALRLGAGRAVALDLDPLAARATSVNAAANGLAAQLAVFRGSLDALVAGRFQLVLANLLRTELLPILPAIAERTDPGAHAVFSGLLAGEQGEVTRALEAAGLGVTASRERRDASGERWTALLTTR